MVGTHPYFRPTLGDPFGGNLNTVLTDPVLPELSGFSFLKVIGVGLALAYVLGKLGKVVK